MSEDIIRNRSEILFLYDVQFGNPNGDPSDENKPRIDEETSKNLVTDVRLKRTVRDYLNNFKRLEIFCREITDEKGCIQTSKLRALDFLKGVDNSNKSFNELKQIASEKILDSCIDVRLFGATIPVEFVGRKTQKGSKKKAQTEEAEAESQTEEAQAKKGTITFTGPVQFKIGQSLHRVELLHIKGTGAFASKEGVTQRTFREEDILPYSLIAFYGVVNENAANTTRLREADIALLMESIWDGTKNLISRSKMVQMPRFLVRVEYKESNYHAGDLDKKIGLITDLVDEQIRHPRDFKLDVTGLVNLLKEKKEKINRIEFKVDPDLSIVYDEEEKLLSDVLSGIGASVEELKF
nr:type I-B CRISPR-associated protein Cas7/Csh2 [Candidatus Freyarchaeota archaeon]